MQNPNDIQKINALYRTTRDQLYDAIRECSAAQGLATQVKHELVQHGLLQWVELNAGWSKNTDRNWELQEPIPFDSHLVSDALKNAVSAWTATSNVFAEQTAHAVDVKSIIPYFQKYLDANALQRQLVMQSGAAPGYVIVDSAKLTSSPLASPEP